MEGDRADGIQSTYRRLEADLAQLGAKATALGDAVAVALDRSCAGPGDAPIVANLRARLAAFAGPLETLQVCVVLVLSPIGPVHRVLESRLCSDEQHLDCSQLSLCL
eukprot:m.136027 g.136027  ORF g.136027 m.136027 type:complete len:107 (+) comp9898_c0_seq8:151-471(+)